MNGLAIMISHRRLMCVRGELYADLPGDIQDGIKLLHIRL